MEKIKISELPSCESLEGLHTIGVDGNNESVKVSLEFVGEAAAAANAAASSANTAAGNATSAASAAETAAKAANEAADAANAAAGSGMERVTEDEIDEITGDLSVGTITGSGIEAITEAEIDAITDGAAAVNAVAVLTNAADSADVHGFDSCAEAAAYATANSGTSWELTVNSGDVPAQCFATLTNLVKLTLGEGVTSIGGFAFASCSGFTGELVIPESVTSIGDYAFQGCSGFTGDLVIPDSVTSIGSYAFATCFGFTGSLVIPGSVTSVGSYAFFYCSGFDDDLSYGGGGNPSSFTNVFNGTNFTVCKVPDDYTDTVFCGLPVSKA